MSDYRNKHNKTKRSETYLFQGFTAFLHMLFINLKHRSGAGGRGHWRGILGQSDYGWREGVPPGLVGKRKRHEDNIPEAIIGHIPRPRDYPIPY